MSSEAWLTYRPARRGCVVDGHAKALVRIVTVVTAALMASMVAETAVASDSAGVAQRCTRGDHSMRRTNHDMCRRAHLRLGRRVAMIHKSAKGPESAVAARPYDYPGSYFLHGSRF